MVFGVCCQRDGLYKTLYVVHIFILAGVLYYYFQKSVGKTAPDYEIAGESPQPIGETLRPVWGLMDKCYPVTTQRRRVKSGKKQATGNTTPGETGGQNGAAPKEETDSLPQGEGQARPPGEEATSPILTEEEEGSGIPGWAEKREAEQEVAVYPPEASVVEQSKEESSRGWDLQLLRKFWPSF